MSLRQFIVALALSLPLLCRGGFSNGQAAAYVLGQSGFTVSDAAPTSLHYWGAGDVAVDTRSGKAFVVDIYAGRILRYANVGDLPLGGAPEAVLGQTSLSMGGGGTSVSQLNNPWGIMLDAAGNLWVADSGNNRVLRFPRALTCASGSPADLVLGQADFTNNGAATTSGGMSSPKAVFLDASGTLWVADTGNNRVLRFASASAKTKGAQADGVLGQSGFTTAGTGSDASGMSSPTGICADAAGHLFVADTINNRVLRFDSAATKADTDGSPADHVLGQPTLSGGYAATSAQKLSAPANLSLDADGTLAVADTNNKRCLLWARAASLGDSAAATVVLGQSDFNAQGGGLTAARFNDPKSAKFDTAGRLWLVDSSARRVLRFDPAPMLGGNFQPALAATRLRRSVVFTISNAGKMPTRFVLTASLKARHGVKTRVRWLLDGANVSPTLRTGAVTSRSLADSETTALVCKPRILKGGGRKTPLRIQLTAASANYSFLAASAVSRLRL
jgi:sugar lactone lactonase YvrE